MNEEVSKNDPIPEISRSDHNLAVILFGPPATGKSTFIKNYILPKNRNIKSFSSDDVSVLLTKNPNLRQPGSSVLNVKRIETYIRTNQNFIYDTTGKIDSNIYRICDLSKSVGYKIIFIHFLTDLATSIVANSNRDRRVDKSYLEFSHSRQFSKMKEYFDKINPDNYYLVVRNSNTYQFYKYDGTDILRRFENGYLSI